MKDQVINKKEMGQRLRTLRDKLAYMRPNVDSSQDALAAAATIHRTGYNAAENGRGGISKEALCRIVNFYRSHGIAASLDWIMLDIEAPISSNSAVEAENLRLKAEVKRLTETLDAQNALIMRVATN